MSKNSHNDIKVDYSPQLRGGGAYLKSDPLYGVYCPIEKTIDYNHNSITLLKGTRVRIKEYMSLTYYICRVKDDRSLEVEFTEDIIADRPMIYGSIFAGVDNTP